MISADHRFDAVSSIAGDRRFDDPSNTEPITDPEQSVSIATSLATKIEAMRSCTQTSNLEWYERHRAAALRIVSSTAPSGAGFDTGTAIDLDESTAERLVFRTQFQHCTESGSYDGWTGHIIRCKASLCYGLDIRCSGTNRSGIREHCIEVFTTWLTADWDLTQDGSAYGVNAARRDPTFMQYGLKP